MRFVTPESTEWERMWKCLTLETGDAAQECQCCGEVWQYMGTSRGFHTFRHRHEPVVGIRVIKRIPERTYA
jgi:hypothetical protein